jgi:hypothetical protein
LLAVQQTLLVVQEVLWQAQEEPQAPQWVVLQGKLAVPLLGLLGLLLEP